MALNALGLLRHLNDVYMGLYSVERPNTKVSNSELSRWIKNGSVEINGYIDRDPMEVIDYPILSVVVHPKSKKLRNTLWRQHA